MIFLPVFCFLSCYNYNIRILRFALGLFCFKSILRKHIQELVQYWFSSEGQ